MQVNKKKEFKWKEMYWTQIYNCWRERQLIFDRKWKYGQFQPSNGKYKIFKDNSSL